VEVGGASDGTFCSFGVEGGDLVLLSESFQVALPSLLSLPWVQQTMGVLSPLIDVSADGSVLLISHLALAVDHFELSGGH
jgi:hypothetical protein